MRKQLVAFITGSCAGGVFTPIKAYNCAKSGANVVGDYQFTLGEAGCDPLASIAEISPAVSDVAADIATPSVVTATETDTTKRIQFRDKGGALVDPLGFEVSWYRMTP